MGEHKQLHDSMTLKEITASSYIKLCTVAGISFGLLMGVFQFIMALINWNAQASFGSITLIGLPASILILVVTPLLYGFYAVVFSMLSYFPFLFLLKKLNGLTVKGRFELNSTDGKEG